MNRTRVSVLAIVALMLPMAVSQARPAAERRDPGMRWFTDMDAAIAEARVRNIPLYVALHKDH